MYRDANGRFATAPVVPVLTYHNQRDAWGRFTKVQPAGQPRDAKGRFAAKSTSIVAKLLAPKPKKAINVADITLADVVNAIRANGLKQVRHQYVGTGINGVVTSACALGQAAVNLGVNYNDLYSRLNGLGGNIGGTIIRMNDSDGLSFKTIADRIEDTFKFDLDKKIKTSKYATLRKLTYKVK